MAEKIAALTSWVNDKIKTFEVTAQQHDSDGTMVDRALELVKKFIIERGLILFGGLAIDFALRLKGDHIYPDEQRPDFDFLSTKNIDDAYDLAEILQKAGFENVGAIRAIHVQTMKVRTNFIWVADIGYTPPDIFSKLPTFNYQGMLVIHPDYQRLDMHLAFCFPFNGAPREDVFHRWQKDLKRFNLFEKYYPITYTPTKSEVYTTVKGKLNIPFIVDIQPIGVASRDCTPKLALHGFAAYAAIRTSLDTLSAAFKLPISQIKAPYLSLTFPDDNTIEVELPVGNNIILASPWPEEVLTGFKNVKKFSPYMDVCPESYQVENITIFSTKSRQLAASLIRYTRDAQEKQFYIVTPQYLLLWLLFEAHRESDIDKRNIYRNFYVHTLEIINAAESMYTLFIANDTNDNMNDDIITNFAMSPFAPTLSTIGNVNLDAAYIIKMATNAEKLKDVPPLILNLDNNIAELLVGLPTNYYPATSKQRPIFKYDASILFRRSGQLLLT